MSIGHILLAIQRREFPFQKLSSKIEKLFVDGKTGGEKKITFSFLLSFFLSFLPSFFLSFLLFARAKIREYKDAGIGATTEITRGHNSFSQFLRSDAREFRAKRHGAARRGTVLDNTRGRRVLRENHPFKMSPLNLQHHRQPLPSPLPPPPSPSPPPPPPTLPTFTVVASNLTPPTSRPPEGLPRTATGFFHPSLLYPPKSIHFK